MKCKAAIFTTALPGGNHGNSGTFGDIGGYCIFWNSTEVNTNYAWNRTLYYGNSGIGLVNSIKYQGFSVRCVKD